MSNASLFPSALNGAGIESGSGEPWTIVLDAEAGATLVLPGAEMLGAAEFSRLGADLMVEMPDGREFMIRDFYAVEQAPTLAGADGTVISADLATRLAGPMTPGLYAQVASATGGAPIGTVETVNGTVTVIHSDGTRVQLAAGDPVFQGDILETATGASIGILLADDTNFAMGESGRMVLDEMVYDPGAGSGSASFSLLSGVASFVSGQISKSGVDAMVVNTPVATIGIRGTHIVVKFDGQEITCALLPEIDPATGAIQVGEMLLYDSSGVFIGTINNANGGWIWDPSTQNQPTRLTFSDDEINSFAGDVVSILDANLGDIEPAAGPEPGDSTPPPVTPDELQLLQLINFIEGGLQSTGLDEGEPEEPLEPSRDDPQLQDPDAPPPEPDPNSAPTGLVVNPAEVDENNDGGLIGVVTVIDDAGDTHTFTVDDPRFEVVDNILRLKDGVSLDHETEDEIALQITATDQDGLSGEPQTVTVTVNDVNEAPTAVTLDNTSIDENVTAGVIGAVSVADVDDGDSHTFTVNDGRFEVVNGVLQLKDGISLNHESESQINLEITATDSGGLSVTQAVSIDVGDVNEKPTDLSLTGDSVVENAALGTVVGSVDVTDPDDGDSHQFSLSDDAGGLFSIDQLTGEITVAGAIDYESSPTQQITVQVTDSGGLSYDEVFQITVQDVGEPIKESDFSNATPPDVAAGVDTAASMTIGDTFQGEIDTVNGGTLRVGENYDGDAVAISLEAGVQYVFQMKGDYDGAFTAGQSAYGGTLDDPYLYVLDSEGNILASNDDGGAQFNALIRFTPTETGTFYLHATSYDYTGTPQYDVDGTYTINTSEGFIPTSLSQTFDGDAAGTTDTDVVFIRGALNGADIDLADVDWTNIEAIDTSIDYDPSGSIGDESLTLSYADVVRVTDDDNVLRIIGDANDTVDIGEGWNNDGTVEVDGQSYTSYSQNDATVLIHNDTGVNGFV